MNHRRWRSAANSAAGLRCRPRAQALDRPCGTPPSPAWAAARRGHPAGHACSRRRRCRALGVMRTPRATTAPAPRATRRARRPRPPQDDRAAGAFRPSRAAQRQG
ncbi:MAG: hypothetical protein ACK55I_14865, partial [bacterium]